MKTTEIKKAQHSAWQAKNNLQQNRFMDESD
jgi:hypothetical protein